MPRPAWNVFAEEFGQGGHMNTQTGADVLALARIRANLDAFHTDLDRGPVDTRAYARHAGRLAANCDELIELVERLTRPAVPTGTGWPGDAA